MGRRRNGSIAVSLTRATPRYAATVFFVKLPVSDIPLRGRGRANHGQFHDASDVNQSKKEERTEYPSAPLSTFPRISACGSRCGSTFDGRGMVTFCAAGNNKRYRAEDIEPPGGAQRSRRVALQVFGCFPCGSSVYDAKKGRTSDRDSPSRCALSLS